MTKLRAKDLMTKEVATLESSASVGEAIALLTDLEVRHLPILDGDHLVGVLSDRDVRQIAGLIAAGVSDGDPEEAREREAHAMNAPVVQLLGGGPVVCQPEDSADVVIDRLIRERVGALVVVDDAGGVCGIISTIDVLAAARGRL